jgi:hypothetical protein
MIYNTDTKVHAVSPTGTTPAHATTDRPSVDTHTDTAAEAREYQARITRLEAESADSYTSPTRRHAIQGELRSLKNALPWQVARWREIDEARKAGIR